MMIKHKFQRATGPVLNSDKEEKHFILPQLGRGKLMVYTLQNSNSKTQIVTKLKNSIFDKTQRCKGDKTQKLKL